MEILGGALTILVIISFIGTIIGLIKPSFLRQTNRWKVFSLGLVLTITLFIVMVIVANLDERRAQKPTDTQPPTIIETVKLSALGSLETDTKSANIF